MSSLSKVAFCSAVAVGNGTSGCVFTCGAKVCNRNRGGGGGVGGGGRFSISSLPVVIGVARRRRSRAKVPRIAVSPGDFPLQSERETKTTSRPTTPTTRRRDEDDDDNDDDASGMRMTNGDDMQDERSDTANNRDARDGGYKGIRRGMSSSRVMQTVASVSAGVVLGVLVSTSMLGLLVKTGIDNGSLSSSSSSSSSSNSNHLEAKQILSPQQAGAFQGPGYGREEYLASEKTVIDLFERATQSVAFVTTYTESRGGFSLNPMETPAGTGSGIVWDTEGRIVTNFHVIRAASGAKITLANKKTYDAELVGSSPDDDVAVLKIKAPKEELVPINVGSSSSLRVGQSTFAIGNPFGLDHTLTTGVLSGLGREMKSPTGRTISNVIQTEASINPGNSGGPLVDAKGRLIGMNTAIYSPSGASAGVGFAIPVDTLKVIANALITNGKVVRPVIGISYLESAQARALGVEKGVLVLDVPDGSEASKAGLKSTSQQTFGSLVLGDVIIGVDGDEITNEGDLFKALDKHKVGDVVTLRVLNADGERTLSLKLSASQK